MTKQRLFAGSILATAIFLVAVAPALGALGPPDSQSVVARPGVALPITLTIADPGLPLDFNITAGPSRGGVDLTTGPMTCASGTCSAVVTYTADSSPDGPDSFDFTVSDSLPETSPAATVSITVDGTPPAVSSFTSAVNSPTNSTSIDYSLVFAESVTGLTGGDFSNAGGATSCIFTPTGSGTTYTVTVTTCGTSGTLQPRLAVNAVTDLAGNTGPTSAADATTTLTLDRVAPAVSSFTSAVNSPTNSTSIDYSLVFAESVTGLTGGDFSNAGGATSCIFTPTGSGTTYTVTVTTCGTSGTLQPRLAVNAVTDLAGNTGPTSAADATTTLTLDRVVPAVSSFTLQAGSDTGRLSTDNVTNAATLVYDLVLSESVTGLTSADFSNAGTATSCTFSPSSSSGTSFTVTVSSCNEGNVGLRLRVAAVQDFGYEPRPDECDNGRHRHDRPDRADADARGRHREPHDSTSLVFSVSASEALNCGTISATAGVDFNLSNISSLGAITGSGTSTCAIPATSSIAGGTSGTSSLTTAGTFSVADDAGNAQTSATGSPAIITVDLTIPTVTSFALQPASDTGRLSTDRLTNAASLVFALVFDQSVTGIASGDFSTSGSATGCVIAPAGSGSAYTVTLTACSTGTLTLTLQASSVFGVGSNVGPSAPTSASVVTIDRAPPTLTLSAITASPSASTSLAYRLTGPEKIDCSTISSVIGVDFVATNLSAIGSITGSGTTVCTIPATSSVVPGLTGTSTLAKASTFSVADDAGNTQTAVAGSPASVTVTPTDTAPVAHNDVGLSVPQNGVAVPLSVLANDTDADLGTVLKISSATAPAHGTVAITGGGTGLTYTPDAAVRRRR